jgi:hypothetical protein
VMVAVAKPPGNGRLTGTWSGDIVGQPAVG